MNIAFCQYFIHTVYCLHMLTALSAVEPQVQVPEFSADSPAFIFSEATKYNETFLCSQPIVGKAVAIQLPASTTILSLAEVQVVGFQV